MRACPVCQIEFPEPTGAYQFKVYCSRRCKVTAKARRAATVAGRQQAVAQCGTHSGYVMHRRRGEKACAECKAAAAEYYRAPIRVALRNDLAHQRRVRLRGGSVEHVSRMEVFERDGWICGLCGVDVDRSLKWPDPMSVSLDHVIPVSLGGLHSLANVQCAHLFCNCVKGNRVA